MRNEKLSWCRIIFFILACWLFFLFFSCTSTKIDSDFSPVFVTNSAVYKILPPELMEGHFDGMQRMNAKFAKNEFEAEIYVIANDEQLSMTIMSEFGTTVAELFYDGEELDFASSVFPKNLRAEYIVADFQFCLYDIDALKSALEKAGVDFEVWLEEMPDGNWAESRILRQKGKTIAKVTKKYEKNLKTEANELKSIKYENFLRGYSYELAGVSE